MHAQEPKTKAESKSSSPQEALDRGRQEEAPVVQHDFAPSLISQGAGRALPPDHLARLSRSHSIQSIQGRNYLLQLQRRYGNRYVQRVLGHSRETEQANAVSPEVEDVTQQSRGGGLPMDADTRCEMESAFGADLGSIRVHTAALPNAFNQTVNTQAIPIDRDGFFREGEYSPGSSSGRALLAHELTHAVQQAGPSLPSAEQLASLPSQRDGLGPTPVNPKNSPRLIPEQGEETPPVQRFTDEKREQTTVRPLSPAKLEEPRIQRNLLDDVSDLAQGALATLRERASMVLGGIRSRVSSVLSGLQKRAGLLANSLREISSRVLDTVRSGFAALQLNAKSLWQNIQHGAKAFEAQLREKFDASVAGLREGWEGLKKWAQELYQSLKDKAASLWQVFKGKATASFGGQESENCCTSPAVLQLAQTRLRDEVEPAIAELEVDAVGAAAQTQDNWTGLETKANVCFSSADDEALGYLDAVNQQLEFAVSEVLEGQTGLQGQTEAAGAEIMNASVSAISGLQDEASSVISDVQSEADSTISGLTGWLSSLGSEVVSLAQAILGGLMGQIRAVVHELRIMAQNALQSFQDTVSAIRSYLREQAGAVLSQVSQILSFLRAQAQTAWKALKNAWDSLKNTAGAVWDWLREGREMLKEKSRSLWEAIKREVSELKKSASMLLNRAETASCEEWPAIRQEARGLGEAELQTGGPIQFKARVGGARVHNKLFNIQAKLGSGKPLDGQVRSQMETAFGTDLSGVRVHTDTEAAALANELNARAFTVGGHVAFAAGEYNPGTLIGDALIAHELAHAIQQQRAESNVVQLAGDEDSAVELDADKSAISAVASIWFGARTSLAGLLENALPRLRTGLALRRCSGCSRKCNTCQEMTPSGALVAYSPPVSFDPLPITLAEAYEFSKENRPPHSDPLEPPTVFGGITGTPLRAREDAREFYEATSENPGDACGRCKPKLPPDPSFRPSPFFAVKAGEYPHPIHPRSKKRCKSKVVEMLNVVVINEGMAKKFKEAEIEHAKDYYDGYVHTFGKFIAAAKELVATGFCPDERTDAKEICNKEKYQKVLETRAGMSFRRADEGFDCYQYESKRKRDDSGWHTFSLCNDPKTHKDVSKTEPDCSKVVCEPDPAKNLTMVNTSPGIDEKECFP